MVVLGKSAPNLLDQMASVLVVYVNNEKHTQPIWCFCFLILAVSQASRNMNSSEQVGPGLRTNVALLTWTIFMSRVGHVGCKQGKRLVAMGCEESCFRSAIVRTQVNMWSLV